MRPKPILVLWLAAPLLIPISRTQIRHHNSNTIPGAGAVALARRSDGADVGERVAFAAAGAAPGRGAGGGEEVLGTRGGVEVWGAGGRLPGGHGGAGGAAAGADLAVVVVRCGGVASFGAGVGGAGAGGERGGDGGDGGGFDGGGGFGEVGVGEGAG